MSVARKSNLVAKANQRGEQLVSPIIRKITLQANVAGVAGTLYTKQRNNHHNHGTAARRVSLMLNRLSTPQGNTNGLLGTGNNKRTQNMNANTVKASSNGTATTSKQQEQPKMQNGDAGPEQSYHVRDWKPTSQQIALIKRTWSNDTVLLTEFGYDVYDHVFETSPEIREQFRELHQYPHEWRTNLMFQKQCLKLAQSISFAVDNLSQPGKIASHFEKLGESHTRYMRHTKANAKHTNEQYQSVFRVFERALSLAAQHRVSSTLLCHDLDDDSRKRALAQWQMLVAFIVRHTYIGFERNSYKIRWR